jgi:hypothetical protein
MGFRSSSRRLEGTSVRRRVAYTPFGPEPYERFTSGETSRRRDACYPLYAVLPLSRACRAFARLGAPRLRLVSVTELGTAPRSTRGNF